MLSEEYKREALRKLKSLTAEEMVEMLEAIGSTRKSISSKPVNDKNAYDFDFSNDAKGKDKGEHVA